MKIPSLKNTNTHDELYRWLKERLRLHNRIGKKTYFPSINVAHFNEDEDFQEDLEEEIEALGKRYNNTLLELDKVREEISRYKEDNKKLVSASKSWCIKYQEIMFKLQEETASYTQSTPLKPLKHKEVDGILNI